MKSAGKGALNQWILNQYCVITQEQEQVGGMASDIIPLWTINDIKLILEQKCEASVVIFILVTVKTSVNSCKK